MSKPAVVITTLEDSPPWLDQRLISAYLQTSYRIHEGHWLRIGELNAAFDHWLTRQQVAHYAFLTAWNPFSQELLPAANIARNRELERELLTWSARVLPGLGVPDAGDWPPEDSFCALGLPPGKALQLGRKYEQNALVFGRAGQAPELWWLPEKPSI